MVMKLYVPDSPWHLHAAIGRCYQPWLLDPGVAGYALSELPILTRSIQPSQKCISLNIIGFVFSDVAGGKDECNITEGSWDEIDREKITKVLLVVAKSAREFRGNISGQRYAEDTAT
jgi:RPAP1-like, C-terminal